MQSNLHPLFSVRKHGKITSVDHVTKRKRIENLCDVLKRLTRLNEHDTCVKARVEVTDGKQFLKKSSN